MLPCGKSILADAPAAKLADVEDVRGALAVDDGHVPRRLSPENTQPELRRLRPLGLEACETAPHDAMTEVGLRPAVDGDVRGPGDERYRFRIGEEAPRPITKQRHEEDNAVLGQAGDRVQQLRHRQSRQIGEGDPVAVAPEVLDGGRLQVTIDLRCPRDHDHLPEARIDLEGGLERRAPLRAQPNAGDVGAQIEPLDGIEVRGAEDGRHTGEELRTMPQEKVQSGEGDGDDEVDLAALILPPEKSRERLVRGVFGREAEIEILGIEVDARGDGRLERRSDALFNGEGLGQEPRIRIEQHHRLPLRYVGSGSGARIDETGEHRAQAHTGGDLHEPRSPGEADPASS